jgi:hypothetical protein
VAISNTDGKRRAKKKQRASKGEFDQPFDPGTALEVLHGAMVRIQALSEAAYNSLEFMPHANTASHRRRIAHMCSLVMVLHEEIAKAVAMGDEMVMRLGEWLKKQLR